MTERNRQYLRQEFQDGERPSGADFTDLVDSFVNKTDDGVTVDPDSNLILSRGLGLGDSASTAPGTLRFNGGRVQFQNGTAWEDIATGSAGVFTPVGGTAHVAYAGGNVGIGTFVAAPTYRLEVNLGANTAEAERVRLGNAVVSNGSAAFQTYAYFSHQGQSSNSAYALRQGPSGNVHLNAPTGQPVSIRQNGTTVRFAVSANGNVIVGQEGDLPSAGTAVLQVNGGAFKNDGSANWSVPSDVRLKEDIRDLEAGLPELQRVRPVRFRYNGKAGTPAGLAGIGVIGQEMEEVFPEMVHRVAMDIEGEADGEDLRVYDGSALTYVLVNAVKELAGRVRELEAALARANGTDGSVAPPPGG